MMMSSSNRIAVRPSLEVGVHLHMYTYEMMVESAKQHLETRRAFKNRQATFDQNLASNRNWHDAVIKFQSDEKGYRAAEQENRDNQSKQMK